MPFKKVILLRHDVDLSLEDALKMAEVENKLKIVSTYFIRIHATRYNPFDHNNYAVLQKLIKMGHEIGLHQEVYNFCQNDKDRIKLLSFEKKIIETMLGQPVYGVSSHLPKKNTIKLSETVLKSCGFRYHAGGLQFNKGAIFVSDSNRRWKGSSLMEAIGRHDKILANIHPIWWCQKVLNTEEIIEFLVKGN